MRRLLLPAAEGWFEWKENAIARGDMAIVSNICATSQRLPLKAVLIRFDTTSSRRLVSGRLRTSVVLYLSYTK